MNKLLLHIWTRLRHSILFMLFVAHLVGFWTWQLVLDGWPPSEPLPRLLHLFD
jgi:hypothetical protein